MIGYWLLVIGYHYYYYWLLIIIDYWLFQMWKKKAYKNVLRSSWKKNLRSVVFLGRWVSILFLCLRCGISEKILGSVPKLWLLRALPRSVHSSRIWHQRHKSMTSNWVLGEPFCMLPWETPWGSGTWARKLVTIIRLSDLIDLWVR